MRDKIPQIDEGTEPPSDKGTVFIFDGDIGDLARLSGRFEGCGFEVHTCMSFEKALRTIEHEAFDLALVDQGSRLFEGRRVIRHLIRYNPAARFIVTACRQDIQCYWQARRLGALDYLEKPVSAGDVNWIIHFHLGAIATSNAARTTL